MNDRRIVMKTFRPKRIRGEVHQLFIIGIIIVLLFWRMNDFFADEIIIPQWSINIPAKAAGIGAVLFLLASAVSSWVITGLERFSDWVHFIVFPLTVMMLVKLLQYSERFVLALIFLICVGIVFLIALKAIVTDIIKDGRQHSHEYYRVMSSCGVGLGLITVVVYLITSGNCLKTVTVEKLAAEQASAVSEVYADNIKRFHPDVWEELSEEKRLGAVSFLIGIESDEHGVYGIDSVELTAENNRVHAYYDNGRIVINDTYFNSAGSYELMTAVLKEFYHSVQYHSVDEYNALDERGQSLAALLSDVEEWAAEIEGSPEQTGQSMENSAGEFAEKRSAEYRAVIERIINSDVY